MVFRPEDGTMGMRLHFMDSRDFWDLHGAKLFPEIASAREKYHGRLQILYGVELGQPQLDPVKTRAFLEAHDLILSWRLNI